MKRPLFVAASLLLISAPVRADFIMENKLENGRMNIASTMKMKGDMVRMDVASGRLGAMSTLIDTKSGDIVQLIHARKMAVKVSSASIKQQAEAARKKAGFDASAPAAKPKATGAKERVGEWNCEIYTWESGMVSARLWVAMDVPKAAEIKAMTAKLNSSGMGALQSELNDADLPGVVVKTETTTPSGKSTLTVTSIREEEVAAADLVVPGDYGTMTPPSSPSGAPGIEKKTK